MECLVVGIAPKKTGRLNFFLLDRCNARACDFKPCQDISPNKTAQSSPVPHPSSPSENWSVPRICPSRPHWQRRVPPTGEARAAGLDAWDALRRNWFGRSLFGVMEHGSLGGNPLEMEVLMGKAINGLFSRKPCLANGMWKLRCERRANIA